MTHRLRSELEAYEYWLTRRRLAHGLVGLVVSRCVVAIAVAVMVVLAMGLGAVVERARHCTVAPVPSSCEADL